MRPDRAQDDPVRMVVPVALHGAHTRIQTGLPSRCPLRPGFRYSLGTVVLLADRCFIRASFVFFQWYTFLLYFIMIHAVW